MCILCRGKLDHFASRRNFLKGTAAASVAGVAGATPSLFAARPAA